MPTDDGLGLNEHEMTPPSTRPQPAKPHPKDAVALSNPQPRLTPKRDLQLIPKGKILEHQVAATSEGCAGYARRSHPSTRQSTSRYQRRPPARVFGSTFAALHPNTGSWFLCWEAGSTTIPI
jgi:hypothetical protein